MRKAHNLGRNHLQQVREYYQKLGFDKAQTVIDSITQDYQSIAVQESTNPFAASAGIPSFAGIFNNRFFSNFAGRPGYTTIGGMTFGGPLPGMPLPPPPGMPLPGGQVAPVAPPGMMNPFGPFQSPAGLGGTPAGPPAPGGQS